MSDTIGFIGVGRMGSRMATNLLDAGYDVVVYDVDPDRVDEMEREGADSSDSIDGIASAADVVMTSLPTSEIVEDVYFGSDGLIDALESGSMVVEMSTIRPATIERIAAALDGRDIQVVDCPVLGPPPDAAAGSLTAVAGCEQAAFERVEPILEVIGSRVEHFDQPGDAKRVKLANNVMNYGNWALAAEMIALVDRMGLDSEHFFEITNSGSASSPIVAAKAPKAFEENYEPGFPVDGARKDLQYALDMKEEEDYPAPIAAAIGEQFTMASALTEDSGDTDYSVMIELFRSLGE